MSDLVFDQWVFGTAPGGSRWHAIMRVGSEGGLFPGAFTMRALCSANGSQGFRAFNEPFDPAAAGPRRIVCTSCSRRWTARHAPQIEGWTKTCRSCREEKPIGQFHVDRRTTDNLSTTCLDCDEAASRAVVLAERIAADAAAMHEAVERSAIYHHQRLDVLNRLQRSSLIPTVTCTLGHELRAVTGDGVDSGRWAGTVFPTEAWLCPCGRVEADPDWASVFETALALDTLAAAPGSAPIDVAGSPQPTRGHR